MKAIRVTDPTTEQKKTANIIARQNGFGRATVILISNEISESCVLSHTNYGYRKHTTGEYVSHKYRNKFGWKNTYYQHAETVVVLAV